GCVWPVLPRRAGLSPRPCAHPNADVPDAVRGGTSDDFPDAHARPVLVYPSRADFMGGRARHANRGDVDSGLWAVYDTHRLGLGTVRMGIRADMGALERPRETASVSGF